MERKKESFTHLRKADVYKRQQKELRRELEKANARLANWQVDGLFDSAEMVKGVKIITGSFSSTTADALRTMSDRVRENAPNSCLLYTSRCV